LRTLFGCGADLTTLVLNERCGEIGQLMVAAGWKSTRALREAESDDARAHVQLAVARLELVRARGFEVCVGLQSMMRLDALQLSEIIRCASAPAGDHMPFHVLWNIAVKVKHFQKRTRT
jgi:hypothetical protein